MHSLQTWLSTPGYPYLNISQSSSESTVTQHQFQAWTSSAAPISTPSKWSIPLHLGSLPDTHSQPVLVSSDIWTQDEAISDGLFVNQGAKGLFRSLYTPDHFEGLVGDLQLLNSSGGSNSDFTQLLDVSTLLDDAFEVC